jgi:hypothetical protein
MKKVLIAIALYVAFMAGQSFEAHRCSAENQVPEGYDFSGVDMMTNYILDVVDETDFWESCDSTAFNMYAENSPEWLFAVCMEYQKWDNLNN